jgi:hypothetical protein
MPLEEEISHRKIFQRRNLLKKKSLKDEIPIEQIISSDEISGRNLLKKKSLEEEISRRKNL